jgi:hypothetical protein
MSVDEFKEIPASIENMQTRSASLRALTEELNNNELVRDQDISGQDISGEYVDTQDTLDAPPEELDTSDEELEDSEAEEEPPKDDTLLNFGRGAFFGAVFIGGLWAYLAINRMTVMEHPYNQRDYF